MRRGSQTRWTGVSIALMRFRERTARQDLRHRYRYASDTAIYLSMILWQKTLQTCLWNIALLEELLERRRTDPPDLIRYREVDRWIEGADGRFRERKPDEEGYRLPPDSVKAGTKA